MKYYYTPIRMAVMKTEQKSFMRRDWDPYTLLVGIKNGTAAG